MHLSGSTYSAVETVYGHIGMYKVLSDLPKQSKINEAIQGNRYRYIGIYI